MTAIMVFWEKIAYIVQLILACLFFLHSVRKRDYYLLRVVLGATVLIIVSYLVGGSLSAPEELLPSVIYWMSFLIVCIFFVWFCLRGTLIEAVYCTVCATAMQHAAYEVYMVYHIVLGRMNPIIILMTYLAIYVFFYRSFARKLPVKGRYEIHQEDLFPMVSILLFVTVLSIFAAEVASFQGIVYHISDALCCYYILWIQVNQKEKIRLQRELDGLNYALLQQKKQYQITRDTIDIINRKCHDLKHQIRALREMKSDLEKKEYFDEVENAIMIYDKAVKTGNEALDIVFMEKGLFCQSHDIQWTCMADGSKMDFMRLEDVYAIFGNALDNAIAAVLELEDPLKRVIDVKTVTRDDLMVIQIQNYYNKVLSFENGLPLTTQKNKIEHGFGMKSILHTVEKYNGTITVRTENNIFMLQMLIPLTKKFS